MRSRFFDWSANWPAVQKALAQDDILLMFHRAMRAWCRTLNESQVVRQRLSYRPGDAPASLGLDWLIAGKPYPHSSTELDWWRPTGACHYLAPVTWAIAAELQPGVEWGLVSSRQHSVIADSQRTVVFDFTLGPTGCFTARQALLLAGEPPNNRVEREFSRKAALCEAVDSRGRLVPLLHQER